MKTTIPVRSLAEANWLMTIVTVGFLSVFLFAYQVVNNEVLFVIIKSAADLLAISFFHILVLVRINRYRNNLSPKKLALYRYLIIFLATLTYSFCTSPIRQFFATASWRDITFKQQIVTTILGSIGLNTFIVILHNLVITYQAKSRTERENARLRIANAEANNLLLKQQVHPHFLFNALNILKSLYKTDVSAGDKYIAHLANFLRAAISNTSAKLVGLNDEINLCSDYIAMQKIRFGSALQYNMNIPLQKSRQGFLPSFSLQPQLENAIKHNIVADSQPLIISVYIQDGYVVIENNLQRKNQPVPSTGNGLMNLIKRYELLSGDEVLIREDEHIFSVSLKILKA